MAFSLAAGTLQLLQLVVLFVFNVAALSELLAIIHLAGPHKLNLFFILYTFSPYLNFKGDESSCS